MCKESGEEAGKDTTGRCPGEESTLDCTMRESFLTPR